jgi:hypothetical protein
MNEIEILNRIKILEKYGFTNSDISLISNLSNEDLEEYLKAVDLFARAGDLNYKV